MNSVLRMTENSGTPQTLIAIYCGSRSGNNPIYLEKAIEYEKAGDYKKSEKYFKIAADKDEELAAILKMSAIKEVRQIQFCKTFIQYLEWYACMVRQQAVLR